VPAVVEVRVDLAVSNEEQPRGHGHGVAYATARVERVETRQRICAFPPRAEAWYAGGVGPRRCQCTHTIDLATARPSLASSRSSRSRRPPRPGSRPTARPSTTRGASASAEAGGTSATGAARSDRGPHHALQRCGRRLSRHLLPPAPAAALTVRKDVETSLPSAAYLREDPDHTTRTGALRPDGTARRIDVTERGAARPRCSGGRIRHPYPSYEGAWNLTKLQWLLVARAPSPMPSAPTLGIAPSRSR
jgi:hypothetical protein